MKKYITRIAMLLLCTHTAWCMEQQPDSAKNDVEHEILEWRNSGSGKNRYCCLDISPDLKHFLTTRRYGSFRNDHTVQDQSVCPINSKSPWNVIFYNKLAQQFQELPYQAEKQCHHVLSPDGHKLITHNIHGEIIAWDVLTKSPLHTLAPEAHFKNKPDKKYYNTGYIACHPHQSICIAFCPSKDMTTKLIFGDLVVWDLNSYESLAQCPATDHNPHLYERFSITSGPLCYSSHGEYLAQMVEAFTCAKEMKEKEEMGYIIIRNAADLQPLRKMTFDTDMGLQAVQCSMLYVCDDKLLAASGHTFITLCDPNTGKSVDTLSVKKEEWELFLDQHNLYVDPNDSTQLTSLRYENYRKQKSIRCTIDLKDIAEKMNERKASN